MTAFPASDPSDMTPYDEKHPPLPPANETPNILHDFAENTTMHGVFRLAKSRSTRGRWFWVCLFMFALVMVGIQLYGIVDRYYTYPTTTTLTFSREPVPFPDITVCNMRNLDVGVLGNLFQIISLHLKSKDVATMLSLAKTEFEKVYLKKILSYVHIWLKYSVSHKESFLRALSRTNLVANFELSVLQMAGIPIWELTLNCQLGRESCEKEWFKIVYDSYFLSCITFQSTKELYLSPGIDNGLSTIALVGGSMVDWEIFGKVALIELPGVSEYRHPLSGSEGARVVIHPRGTRPFPRAEGFNVPPGYAASIGLKVRRDTLLGKPFTSCESANSKYTDNFTYRLASCTGHCTQQKIMKTCHCVSSEVPYTDTDLHNMTFCGYVPDPEGSCADVTQDPEVECLSIFQIPNDKMACAKEMEMSMTQEDFQNGCKCFPPCTDLTYEAAYSLSRWPAGQELDIMYRDIFQQGTFYESLNSPENSEEKISLYKTHFNFSNRHNAMPDFARINVYIADDTVTGAKETEAYSRLQLVSDIGGQLGLWVGMSVLSFGELLQLIMELAVCIRYSVRRRRKVVQNDVRDKKVDVSHSLPPPSI